MLSMMKACDELARRDGIPIPRYLESTEEAFCNTPCKVTIPYTNTSFERKMIASIAANLMCHMRPSDNIDIIFSVFSIALNNITSNQQNFNGYKLSIVHCGNGVEFLTQLEKWIYTNEDEMNDDYFNMIFCWADFIIWGKLKEYYKTNKMTLTSFCTMHLGMILTFIHAESRNTNSDASIKYVRHMEQHVKALSSQCKVNLKYPHFDIVAKVRRYSICKHHRLQQLNFIITCGKEYPNDAKIINITYDILKGVDMSYIVLIVREIFNTPMIHPATKYETKEWRWTQQWFSAK